MNNALKAFWGFITSRNVAIVLLIIVTSMLAAGAFLPNPVFMTPEQKMELHLQNPVLEWLGERFNSQTIAGGSLFGFIGIFLIVSTALCSIDRLMKIKNVNPDSVFLFPFSSSQEGLETTIDAHDLPDAESRISEWFNKR